MLNKRVAGQYNRTAGKINLIIKIALYFIRVGALFFMSVNCNNKCDDRTKHNYKRE